MEKTVLLADRVFSKQWFTSWALVLLGSLVLALGFVLFINPYNITPGGIYGIGIVLHHFFPDVQVGTFGLCMDIPLLLIAFRVFGAKFGAKTIVSALLTPLLMNFFVAMFGSDPATMLGGHIDLRNDLLLASLFGGLFVGTGLGIIFKNRATSGGTDIIAMLITRFLHQPLSRSMIITESLVVVAGLVVFGDWKLPLYSIIAIYVYVTVIDYIVEGGSNDKLLFIISEKPDRIREYIIGELDRGGTIIKTSGMYTMQQKEMLFVVVSRRQLALVQAYIRSVDPRVFMVVVNAHETLGDGFKSFNDKIINA